MGSNSVQKVFATVEEAKTVKEGMGEKGRKLQVFKVRDESKPDRLVFVVEKAHPLARSAAALSWGITAQVAEPKDRGGPRAPRDPRKVATNAFSKLTPEERAELLAQLQSA